MDEISKNGKIRQMKKKIEKKEKNNFRDEMREYEWSFSNRKKLNDVGLINYCKVR